VIERRNDVIDNLVSRKIWMLWSKDLDSRVVAAAQAFER